MGNEASTLESTVSADVSPEKQWEHAEKLHKGHLHYEVNASPGIKTVRIFVSSTFVDFYSEREVLVKEVMPELRAWSRERNVDLIECDLRWGIPKDSSDVKTIKTCLGEINRCQQVNYLPFFINMTGERSGWAPKALPKDIIREYNWVFGMSITEMEIMHGAYWIDNPNALFLLRHYSFMDSVPEELRRKLCDEKGDATQPRKVDILRKQLVSRFSDGRCKTYTCRYDSYEQKDDRVRVTGLGELKKIVLEFFKKQIAHHYPESLSDENVYRKQMEAQQAFMANRIALVGRKAILKRVKDYLGSSERGVFVLVGGSGVGKSSIMAAIAKKEASQMKFGKRRLFYHFVGAAPGSTDVVFMLKRFLKDIFGIRQENLPTETKEIMKMVNGHLSASKAESVAASGAKVLPIVILIDAVNQLAGDSLSNNLLWLPKRLQPSVKIVLSVIESKSILETDFSGCVLQTVSVLDKSESKTVFKAMLKNLTKSLSDSEMSELLSKASSKNPLWLSIACEQLRVHSNYDTVKNEIANLPDNLNDLWIHTLERIEEIALHRELIVATLSLLEASKSGLLESELRDILATCKGTNPSFEVDRTVIEGNSDMCFSHDSSCLLSTDWSNIYGLLGNFLRPFGGNCEGRLDFYHRSLSKAVRTKYFKVDTTTNPHGDRAIYNHWHNKLANYFQGCDDLMERKLEEYPHHLLQLGETERLATFLVDWRYVERLCVDHYCTQLLKYWRQVCSYVDMKGRYEQALDTFVKECQLSEKERDLALVDRYLLTAKIFTCASLHDQCLSLLNEALKIEREGKTPRKEHLCRIYELFVRAYTNKSSLLSCYNDDFRSLVKALLPFAEKAIELRESQASETDRYNLGWIYNAYAFGVNAWAECLEWEEKHVKSGDIPERTNEESEMSFEEAKKKTREFANKAIVVFKQCNDPGSVLDAEINLARSLPMDQEYIRALERIIGRCHDVYGTASLVMESAVYDLAMTHHYFFHDQEANEHLRAAYQLRLGLYGGDHARTKQVASFLLSDEFSYKAINEKLGRTILPSTIAD